MKLGIVGYGYVGRSLHSSFKDSGHSCLVYDRNVPELSDVTIKAQINRCELVLIAVPTNLNSNGECDLSEVDDVVSWVTAPMCLKSTVLPGTVDRLIERTGKSIAFSPEYAG